MSGKPSWLTMFRHGLIASLDRLAAFFEQLRRRARRGLVAGQQRRERERKKSTLLKMLRMEQRNAPSECLHIGSLGLPLFVGALQDIGFEYDPRPLDIPNTDTTWLKDISPVTPPWLSVYEPDSPVSTIDPDLSGRALATFDSSDQAGDGLPALGQGVYSLPDLDEPADDPRSKLHAGGGGGGGGSGGWNGGATGIGNPLEYQATAGSGGGLSLPTYPPSGPKPPQHGTSGAQAPSGPSAAASSASPGLANAGSTASAGTQNAAQPGPALPFEGSPNQGGIASSAPSAMTSSAASDSSTLRFEPNIGQAVAGADYVAQAQGLQVSLNAGGMTFDLGTPQTASAPADPADLINLEFIGGNANAQSQGLDPASTVSQDNGPTGSLATSPTSPNSPTSPTPTPGLPTPSIDYGQVTYQSVWQGIDATYLSNAQNQFSFDLTVNPGADPSQIDIGVTGASSLAIGAGGSLSIEDGNGSTLTEAAPYIYQTVNGVQQQIAGQYVLLGNDRIGFQLGQYNHALALVIDPSVSFSSISYLASDSVSVTGNASSSAPGTITVDFSGAGSGWVYANSDGSFSATVSTTGAGTLYATAVDSEGNSSDPASIDVSPGTPSVSLTSITYGEDGSVTVSGTASSPQPGAITVNFSGDGTSGWTSVNSDGTFSATLTCSGAGTIEAVATDSWELESSAASIEVSPGTPSVSLTSISYGSDDTVTVSGTASSPQPGAITVNFSGDGTSGWTSVNSDGSFSATLTCSGVGTINAVATDSWELESSTASIDVSPGTPSVSLTSITYGADDSVTVSGTASSPQPGAITVSFSGDGTSGWTSVNSDGTFSATLTCSGVGTINAVATDSWELQSSAASIDVSPGTPSVSLTSITYLGDNQVTVSGTASSPQPGAITVSFSGDGTSGWTSVNSDGTFSDTLTCSGAGTINAVATDSWGLESAPASITNDPPAPTISLSVVSWTAISVSFTAPAGASGVDIYRSTSASGPFTEVASGVATSPYLDSGLVADTTFYYYAAGSFSEGEGPASGTVSATTGSDAPTSLSATANSYGDISLSFTLPAGVSGANIYRSTSPDSGFSQIATDVMSGYDDSPLEALTTYYYYATAYNPGFGGTLTSSTVSATTLSDAPTSLTLTPNSDTDVLISFSLPSGLSGANIWRSTSSSGPFTQIATDVSSNYDDSPLYADTTYYYYATAYNPGYGGTIPSSIESVTTDSDAATSIAATALTPSEIALTFSLPFSLISVNVWRSTSASGPFSEIATNQTSPYLDGGLVPGTTYYYYVKTVNAYGGLQPSSTVNATTLDENTSTSLTTSATATTYGDSVTLTATVTAVDYDVSNPDYGTVSFKDGSTVLETFSVDSSGVAAWSTTGVTVGSYTITAVYNGYAGYNSSTSSSVSLTVSQADLVITADNKSMDEGNALPTLTASYSGFVNGDTSASLTTLPTLSTDATSGSDPGIYNISVSGAADPNYTISYVDGIMTVNSSSLDLWLPNPGTASFLDYAGEEVYGYSLDLDQSPGRAVGDYPQLVYNSGTVDPAPVIQLSVELSGFVSSLGADLYWNGTEVEEKTFGIGGSNWHGSISMQAPAGQATGAYAWTVDVDGASVSGVAFVVNEADSPFGAGWNLSYLEELVPIGPVGPYSDGGMLRIFGNGSAEFFADEGGSYVSPSGDSGILLGPDGGDGSGYSYIDSTGDVYTFNPSGQMTGWTAADGSSAFTFTYDYVDLVAYPATIETPDDAVTSVVYSSGMASALVVNEADFEATRTYTMTYSSGDLTQIDDPATGLTTYTYDTEGHLTGSTKGALHQGIVYDAGSGQVAEFDVGDSAYYLTPALSQGLGSAVEGNAWSVSTDPLGNTTKSLFNQFGEMIEQVSPNGGVSLWTYNGNGFMTTYTNPLGEVTTYTVNAAGYDTTIETPTGAITTYTYDGNNDLLTETNPLGNTTTYTYYSSSGLLESSENALDELTTYTYDNSGNLLTVTNPLDETTSYVYDSDNRPIVTIDPLGNRTTVTYDANGNPLTVTDPNGNVTTTLYDTDGNLVETIDPLGNITTNVYDPNNGELIGTIDPLGDRTSFVYDSAGDETEEIDAVGTALQRTITMTYDADGNLISSTNALNETTTYTYDGDGNLVAVTNPLGETTTSVYNAADEAIATIDPRGYALTTVYDADGEAIATIDPLGNRTTTVYDADGNVIGVTDPNGYTTSFIYDAANELTATVDPLGNRATTVYDAAGDAVESIDPRGNITTMVYDNDGQLTTVVDPLGNRTTMVYDGDGNIVETIDPRGFVTTTVYDADDRPVVNIDPLGNRTTVVYDGDGNVVETIDPNGNITTYVFDALGRDTVTIDPLLNRTTYTYDALDDLVAVTDPNVYTTSFVYDAAGELTVVIDPLGNRTTMVYDADGNIVETIDPRGFITTTVYDADDRPIATIDPLGNTTTTVYDGDGNVTETIDPRGYITTTVYDADDRPIVTIDPLGNRTTTVYDCDGNIVNTIDADGFKTTYVYDADDELIATVDPLGDRTTLVYDADGNVVETIDPLGNITTTVYDADDRPIVTIDPLGNITTTVYDGDGNVVETVDARGYATSYVYNADNELTGTIDPLGNRTTIAYDGDGNVIATTNADGFTTSYVYDADDEQTEMIDPLGNITATAYDADGNVIATVDAEGNRTTYAYDADDEQISVEEPSGGITTTVYDADGNVVNTIDPLGDTTTSVYNADDELVQSIDADGDVTSFQYDGDGNLTALTDPDGNVTTSVYDGDDRLIETMSPIGNTTYSYDADSNLTGTTDALGQVRDFTYNADGEEIGQKWFNSSGDLVNTQTFTYDADGDQLTAADENGAYTYTYDADDRVASVQEPFGLTLTFTYDGVGNRLTVQDSEGGLQTSTYDGDNNLTEVQFTGNGATLSYDYTYTGDNQVAMIEEFSDLSGTTLVGETEDSYDTTGRMTGQEFIDGSDAVYRSVTYTYNNADELTSENDNGTVTTFAYDATGQLLGNGATTYTYDANGNRDSSGYSVGADNEITNDGTWTYTYDADGDLIEQSEGADAITWYYTYDVANQLVQAAEYTAPGGSLEEQIDYTYDVYGDLLSRTQYNGSNGSLDVVAVANFGYDGWSTQLDSQGNSPSYIGQENWNIWVTLDASNDLTTRTLFGNSINDPVARITPIEGESTSVAWYVADYQGSIIGMLDGSGSVAATMTYDGFGNQTSNSNPSFTDQYGFQGMRFESADNSYDDNARWLNMYLGRFDSQDPIGFAAGDADLYRFVGNGFTDWADPSGFEQGDNGWNWSNVSSMLISAVAPIVPAVQKTYETGNPGYLTPGGANVLNFVNDMRGYLNNGTDPVSAGILSTYRNTPYLNDLVAGAELGFNMSTDPDKIGTNQSLNSFEQTQRYMRIGFDLATLGFGFVKGGGRITLQRTSSTTAKTGTATGGTSGAASGPSGGAAPIQPNQLKANLNTIETPTAPPVEAPAPSAGPSGNVNATTKPTPPQQNVPNPGPAQKATPRIPLQQTRGPNCFAAGTPLLIPEGHRPIEAFRPGDHILSRPESNCDAPVEVKEVEEVFVRVSPIFRVQVGGRVISTTDEHPFFVRGKGWLCAKELKPGDLLNSHDGQWITLESVSEQFDVTTVYNLRVRDFHTYFVGGKDWGFSVWAHNAEYTVQNGPNGTKQVINSNGDVVYGGSGLTEEAANALAQQLNSAAPATALAPFDGKTTQSVLITNEGRVVPLESSEPNPTYGNYPAAGHAEGKAAIWIRENRSTGGVLYHNNPKGTCGFCNAQVPTLLPEGATLKVVAPEGTVPPPGWFNNPNPYVGNSANPKPNQRLGGN